MKQRIVRAANALLAPFGARLVGAYADTVGAPFDMPSAIRRIAGHHLPVRGVVDIGASDGAWSREAMKSFPDASFLAIEPLQERQSALEGLRRRHDNFSYALCVAADRDGAQVTLDVAADLDGSTVGGRGGSSRSVPARTVDSLVREHRLPGPFLLKFDTHGYEAPILAGAAATLANTSVIVMEVYNFTVSDHALRFPEMCQHLEQRGFRCYDAAGFLLRPRDRALWQMDLLFARSDAGIFSSRDYR